MVDERNVPEGWGIKKLSEVAPLQRGFDLPTGKIKKGSYPVVYSNGISNYHSEFKVKGPGVITGRSGTIGKVHYADDNYWPHNTALWVTDFKENNPRFIYYLYTYVNLEKFASGSGVPTLNRNDVHSFEMLVPSCSEQKAIAEALSDTDNLIQSLEKLIDKKKKIKQGAMQQLLAGKKRLPGFSGEWSKVKVKDIGYAYGGLSGKSKSDFDGGNKPYITFLNVMNNTIIEISSLRYVSVKSSESQNRVSTGDLLFNTSSETPEEVGMCSVLLGEIDELYLNSFCFGFRIYDQNLFDPLYLAYFFRSNEGRKLFFSLAQGATRYNLSKNLFYKIEFKHPIIQEQKAIAQVLSDMDAEIEALEEKLEKYKTIKQGMMQELLTGRIRLI
jgi:type I restriction enzyme S subunit